MIYIKYEPRKDLKNWLRIKEKYPESFKITRDYPFDKKIELKKENFERILDSIIEEKVNIYNDQAKMIKRAWLKKENKIVKNITEYLNIPFEKFDLKVNLTTAYLMPYDFKDKWLMVPTHKKLDKQMECLTHELFHLYQVKKNPNITDEKREKEAGEFLVKLLT